MSWLILFVFGAAVGSFLNVVALRYDGDHFLFNPKIIGGRSHCPHCKKNLQWYELIPIVSWIIQGAKCRNCDARIGWQYPLVELLSGFIWVSVALRFSIVPALIANPSAGIEFSAFWIFALEILLLISYVDLRLGIVPDELNVLLLAAALGETYFLAKTFGIGNPSFLGPHAATFGLQANVWENHIAAAFIGAAFFGILVAITRGRGMGLGDVKLAFPLGFLFGWPDILFIIAVSFILGGIFGIILVLTRKRTMKSTVAFAPFLVVASGIAFFAGSWFTNGYFHLIGL